MSTHNICLYKEAKKKCTGCNLKTTEFLDCALIGVCAVIRSNTVLHVVFLKITFPLYVDQLYKLFVYFSKSKYTWWQKSELSSKYHIKDFIVSINFEIEWKQELREFSMFV